MTGKGVSRLVLSKRADRRMTAPPLSRVLKMSIRGCLSVRSGVWRGVWAKGRKPAPGIQDAVLEIESTASAYRPCQPLTDPAVTPLMIDLERKI